MANYFYICIYPFQRIIWSFIVVINRAIHAFIDRYICTYLIWYSCSAATPSSKRFIAPGLSFFFFFLYVTMKFIDYYQFILYVHVYWSKNTFHYDYNLNTAPLPVGERPSHHRLCRQKDPPPSISVHPFQFTTAIHFSKCDSVFKRPPLFFFFFQTWMAQNFGNASPSSMDEKWQVGEPTSIRACLSSVCLIINEIQPFSSQVHRLNQCQTRPTPSWYFFFFFFSFT